MRGFFISAALLGCILLPAAAQEGETTERLDSVVVAVSRAGRNTPVAYTMVGKRELSSAAPTKSVPMILSWQPSVVTTNEGGCTGSSSNTTNFIIDATQQYIIEHDEICAGELYSGHGFTNVQISNDTILARAQANPIHGECQDSVLVYIDAHQQYHIPIDDSRCWQGEPGVYDANGFSFEYTEPGTYDRQLYLMTTNGCDSVLNLHLTVADRITYEFSHHECDGSYLWDGQTYDTPGDYELKKTNGVVTEQINRPTGLLDPKIELFPIQGQMDVLLYRIEEVVKNGDRVLVTTLTKKMAQDLTEFFIEAGVRAKYLHSDIKTLERHELIRGLRSGEYDVLVGINLLREGLDLPEVSMVAILDADKEGFLRNYRSLIQTMGRASRNVNGTVLLFADNMTESLQKAIDETNRRRTLQEEFNAEHHITPKSVTRKIEEDLRIIDPLGDIGDDTTDNEEEWEDKPGIRPMEPLQPSNYRRKTKDERRKKAAAPGAHPDKPSKASESKLADLERQMKEAAARLEFEEAARIRDIIRSLDA